MKDILDIQPGVSPELTPNGLPAPTPNGTVNSGELELSDEDKQWLDDKDPEIAYDVLLNDDIWGDRDEAYFKLKIAKENREKASDNIQKTTTKGRLREVEEELQEARKALKSLRGADYKSQKKHISKQIEGLLKERNRLQGQVRIIDIA